MTRYGVSASWDELNGCEDDVEVVFVPLDEMCMGSFTFFSDRIQSITQEKDLSKELLSVISVIVSEDDDFHFVHCCDEREQSESRRTWWTGKCGRWDICDTGQHSRTTTKT